MTVGQLLRALSSVPEYTEVKVVVQGADTGVVQAPAVATKGGFLGGPLYVVGERKTADGDL